MPAGSRDARDRSPPEDELSTAAPARLRRLACLCILLLAAAGAPVARAIPGLTLGFSADPVLTGPSAATRATWIPRAVALGAQMVRVNVYWSEVAPSTRPAGFAASDPASPGYDWTPVDAAVRDLSAHGLTVLMNIHDAPAWAEGANPPLGAPPGSWQPDPSQFASFATAAALRYDGRFPDPLRPGAFLPRVRDWQAWNEPNLDGYLSPQWTHTGGGYQPASPTIYRALLNAFYAAVKGVSSSNFVVTAGTAPYGDPPGGHRMPPVEFDRGLFCLHDDARLTPASCPDPPHLDALAHHPYGGAPLFHALNPDDVSPPDIYKLARVLHAAERTGHVLPAGPKSLWVTEISWDSSPPDPHGAPIAEQARWVEQGMYVFWRQGVDTVLFQQIADLPPGRGYAFTVQGGMYYVNGSPKPAAIAYRFPLVGNRVDRRHVQAWGRAPAAGRLRIEVRRGRRWTVVRRLRVRTDEVFLATLAIRGRPTLRAQIGGQTSLPWTM